MKGQQKISRGLGFRGAMEYDLDHDNPQILGGNMSGATARELAREFGQSRRIRSDIQKPVWRNSLSLPRGETLDAETWTKIANDYMSEMGFLPTHQRVYILHNKPGQQHVHITASRVSMSGKIYLGQNENLRSTKIIHDLEKKYCLTPTPSGTTPKPRRAPKKPEIDKACRTLTKPPRIAIADLVDKVLLTDRPKNPESLKSSLAARGVEVEFFEKDGEIRGITFHLDGLKFAGASLGSDYKFPRIAERMKHDTTIKTSVDSKPAHAPGDGPGHSITEVAQSKNQRTGKKGLPVRAGRRATPQENQAFQTFLGDKKMEDQKKMIGGLYYQKRHPSPLDPESLSHGWSEYTDKKGKVWLYPADEQPRPGNMSGYSWQPRTDRHPAAIEVYDTAIQKVGLEQSARDCVRIAIFKGMPEPISTHGSDEFRKAVAREMFALNIECADATGPARDEINKLHKARHEETEKTRLAQVNSISASFAGIDDQASQARRARQAAAEQEDTPSTSKKDDDQMRMRGPRQRRTR